MAECEIHLIQADHNRDCARMLTANPPAAYRDWAVIAAFYAALHYLEALLTTTEEKHSLGSHADRVKLAGTYLGSAYFTYWNLYQTSRDLRYLEKNNSADKVCGKWLPKTEVRTMVRDDLDKLRDYVTGAIEEYEKRAGV